MAPIKAHLSSLLATQHIPAFSAYLPVHVGMLNHNVQSSAPYGAFALLIGHMDQMLKLPFLDIADLPADLPEPLCKMLTCSHAGFVPLLLQ